jgi:acetylglutamate kinase
MIPKIETAIDAVEKGVHAAVILDGRIPHVLLLELFTEHGAGTLDHTGLISSSRSRNRRGASASRPR